MGLSAVISFFTHHHHPSLLYLVLNLFNFHLILTVFTFRWTLYMRRLNKKIWQQKLQSHFQILLGSLNFWHLLGRFHSLAGTLAARQIRKLFIVYHFSASTVHSHMFVHTLVHMFPWHLTHRVLMTAESLNGIASAGKHAHRRLSNCMGHS